MKIIKNFLIYSLLSLAACSKTYSERYYSRDYVFVSSSENKKAYIDSLDNADFKKGQVICINNQKYGYISDSEDPTIMIFMPHKRLTGSLPGKEVDPRRFEDIEAYIRRTDCDGRRTAGICGAIEKNLDNQITINVNELELSCIPNL
ncbi:hypothetical protein J4440_00980 [Candidatus Woesearchaeota archaeon]|nr:hypothetical protein [Candidatus Woesearchaeota archaeon]